MERRWVIPVLVAILVSVIGMAAAGIWWRFPWLISSAYTWKIATGPIGTEGQKLLIGFIRDVHDEFPHIKLQAIPTPSMADNARTLLDGTAHLAVARSDDPDAGRVSTLIILRKLAVAFLVDPHSKIDDPKDLKGKKIAIVDDPNDRFLKSIIEFFGFAATDIVPVARADLGKAFKDKRVAGAIVLGPIGPGAIGDAVGSIKKAIKRTPSLLAIDEAEAIAKRYPVYDKVEIPKAEFDGTPDDAADTVAVTLRLMASNSLSDYSAGTITRLILRTKARLAATFPAVGQIEAPDTDAVNVLPIHPGAAAYLKGDQQSLYSMFSDNLYTFILIGGIFGPMAGWAMAQVRKRKPDQIQIDLTRLSRLHDDIHSLPADQRDEVEKELDRITAGLFNRLLDQKMEPDRFLCASAIIDRIRDANRRSRQPAH